MPIARHIQAPSSKHSLSLMKSINLFSRTNVTFTLIFTLLTGACGSDALPAGVDSGLPPDGAVAEASVRTDVASDRADVPVQATDANVPAIDVRDATAPAIDAHPDVVAPGDAAPDVIRIADASPPRDASTTPEFSARYGSAAEDQVGRAIASDAAGNVYVFGHFEGSIDLGGGALTSLGAQDLFLAKFSPAGAHVWSKRIGDASAQFASSLVLDTAGNIVVAGYFGGTIDFGNSSGALVNTHTTEWDTFVAKLDSNGDALFARTYGDPDGNQEGWWAAVDPRDNGIVVCAHSSGAPTIGTTTLPAGTGRRVIVFALSSTGTVEWAQSFGNATDTARCGAVAVSSDGVIYLAGQFTGSMDFSPVLTSAGGRDTFVARLSESGTVVWANRYGDTEDQQGRRIAVLPDGDIAIATYFAGTVDFGCGNVSRVSGDDALVVRLSPTGACRYSRALGGFGNEYLDSLATDTDGTVFAAGSFEGSVTVGSGSLTAAGMRDIWVVGLDLAGAPVYSLRTGDAELQDTAFINLTTNGDILLTGRFRGAMELASTTLTSATSHDLFVARIRR